MSFVGLIYRSTQASKLMTGWQVINRLVANQRQVAESTAIPDLAQYTLNPPNGAHTFVRSHKPLIHVLRLVPPSARSCTFLLFFFYTGGDS